MKTIKISDKETFDAVYGLIENCLPSSGGYFCENGKIRSGDTLFVFSEEGEDGGGEEAAKAFGRFDVLKARGAAVQNSAKLWDAFVANVLDDFYKDNAYLVYKPIESRADAAVQIEMVKKLVELLNPELFRENTKLEIKPDSKVNDLVYEVAVKLKMRLGGEPVSVINKFYIEDTSDGLRAVSGARCRMLYLQINEKIKSAAAVKEAAASDLAPITGGAASEIIKVISELLASEDGFQDYLTGEAEKAFYGYAEKQKEILESAEIEEITCSDAKLRYIAALTLLNKSYICSSFVGGKEKRLFRFAFSASNAITAVCLQCGETLISSNVFTVTAGDVTASVTLDTAKYAEGFGLDDPKNNPLAKTYGERERFGLLSNPLSEHSFMVSCDLGRGVRCVTFACKNKRVTCNKAGCGAAICTECPEDMVTVRLVSRGGGVTGTEYLHTPCLVFCYDTLSLLPEDETKLCACCGKRYSLSYFEDGSPHCGFCASVISPDRYDSGVRARFKYIYRRHRDMLPLALRRRGNFCNENQYMILFAVGGKAPKAAKNQKDGAVAEMAGAAQNGRSKIRYFLFDKFAPENSAPSGLMSLKEVNKGKTGNEVGR